MLNSMTESYNQHSKPVAIHPPCSTADRDLHSAARRQTRPAKTKPENLQG